MHSPVPRSQASASAALLVTRIPGVKAFILDNVLTQDECSDWMVLAEVEGFEYSKRRGRPRHSGKRQRSTITSPELAAKLWAAIQPYMQEHEHDVERPGTYSFSQQHGEVPTGTYVPHGVSPLLRFSKYVEGDEFKWHTDSTFAEGMDSVGFD